MYSPLGREPSEDDEMPGVVLGGLEPGAGPPPAIFIGRVEGGREVDSAGFITLTFERFGPADTGRTVGGPGLPSGFDMMMSNAR